MAKKQAPLPPPVPNAPAPGKSKVKLIILILLALLVAVGLSVGATWFLLSKDKTEEEPKEATPAAPVRVEAIYEPLMPAFVVNFNHQGRQRYMQVSMTLMTRDQLGLDALKVHMPLLRNNLVMLLSSQDFAALSTAPGIELLRQQVLANVQGMAQKEVGKPVVEQVLFTNFVLQ